MVHQKSWVYNKQQNIAIKEIQLSKKCIDKNDKFYTEEKALIGASMR